MVRWRRARRLRLGGELDESRGGFGGGEFGLFEDELGGVFGEVGGIGVLGEEAADAAAEVGADGFTLLPIEFGHGFDGFGEFAG